ncbi:MAG: sensor hybrid histidine kinase [Clostridia bacterium]|nr:sensor hybrid histidine kinase [Clostridia bacterium]
MLTGTILYLIYSSISISVLLIMAVQFWKRRLVVGAGVMTLIMILAAEWSVCIFLSSMWSDLNIKIFWGNLSFIGIAFIPVMWLIFSLQYTQEERWLKRKYIYLLLVIPFITLVMVFTNPYHQFFASDLRSEVLEGSTIQLLVYEFTGYFWIHAAYSVSLIMSGMMIFINTLGRFSKIYTKQVIIILLAILIPLIGQGLFLFHLGPVKNLDTTTFSFTFTGILFFIGMFRYRMLDFIPITGAAVIEAMEDLVIVLDNQKRVIDINVSALNRLSKRYEQVIGQDIKSAVEHIGFDEEWEIVGKSSKISVNLKDEKKYYDIKRSPLYDKRNHIIGGFVVLRDITNLEKTVRELEKAKYEAEQANKAKSEFLATISHEIRTPINGIVGMAELLKSAMLSEEEKENLKVLEHLAEALLNIINDILDFSKIEAGRMELQKSSMDIRELIADIVKSFSYTEKRQQVALNCYIDEQVPNIIYTDSARLKQILVNLLSNAFKFTEKGKIDIHIESIREQDHEVMLLFSVTDTGIGIAKDKLKTLFQTFYQVDSTSKRKYGGTGLGLSIVKKLVELMGGKIGVESEEGLGSKFSFEMTFEKVNKSSINEELSIKIYSEKDMKLHILVVEDSKVNQLLIKKILVQKNWVVETANNGKEALEKLEKEDYDLILMDIQMPVMDGYEASKIIREKEKITQKHIPIIALTANSTEEDQRKSIEAGMDEYLTKPIKSENLYLNILKYIILNQKELL